MNINNEISDFFKLLETLKETIIICNNSFKKEYLKNVKKIYNVKFYTLNEFIDNVTFNISDDSIYYLMKDYNYTYDVAKLYIDNLKSIILYKQYIQTSNEISKEIKEKFSLLDNIYNYLKQKNLINENIYFKNYIRNKTIIFVNTFLSKENKFYLKDYKIIEYKITSFKEKDLTCVKCKDFEEELFYVLENICTLIDNNVTFDDIKIVYQLSNQDEKFKEISDYYKVPINGLNYKILTDIPFIKKYIYNELAIDDLTEQDKMILSKIKEFPQDNYLYSNYLYSKYKNTKIFDNYLNGIEIIDIEDIHLYKNKHIFIMRCNQGLLYKHFKNEDYFSDNIKETLNMSTSVEKNKYVNKNVYETLYTDNIIYLSYSMHANKDELYPETFIEDYKIKVLPFGKEYSLYSNKYNELLLCKYLDDFYKYNIFHQSLPILLSTYDIKYATYDNIYKDIDLDDLYKRFNDTLRLSYTKLNQYYQCPFSYYIKYILKIDNLIEDNFNTFLGSIFHYVLSKAFIPGFDFEKTWDEFLLDYLDKEKIENQTYVVRESIVNNYKNKYLLIKLKDELIKIINEINRQNEFILYDKQEFEKNVEIKDELIIKGKKFKRDFIGKIDKIYYKENNGKKYIAIVDYKTGKEDFKLNLVKYGLKLQLPIYLYLIKNLKGFEDGFIYGFYLQKIESYEKINNHDDKYEKNKQKEFYLKGYSAETFPEEARFDRTMDSSNVIYGMALTKNGSYDKRTAKVLSLDEIEKLYNNVKDKIDEATINILNGKFEISPKISSENNACEYCKFNDICYVVEKDINRLDCEIINTEISKNDNDE